MYKASKEGRKDIIDLMLLNDDYSEFDLIKGACEGGHVDIINMINSVDYNYKLAHACFGGHLALVKMMIDLGANDFNWGLYFACKGGHIEVINMMISLGADDFNWGLRGACRGGHVEIVKMMISLGADINYYICSDNIEVVKLFIDTEMPYEIIYEGDNIEIVKLLFDKTSILYFGGNIEILKFLMEKDAVEEHNVFLLHAKNIEVMKLLISHGANNYEYGLRAACFNNDIEGAKLMISLGATKYNCLRNDNLEFHILYSKLTSEFVTLPIKTQHPEYHLLKVYNKRIPDIDRLINKYLF